MPYHASGDTCQQANASNNYAGLTGTYWDPSKDVVGMLLTAQSPHWDGETHTGMQRWQGRWLPPTATDSTLRSACLSRKPCPHRPRPCRPRPHIPRPHRPCPHKPRPHRPCSHKPHPHKPHPRRPRPHRPHPRRPRPHKPRPHKPRPRRPRPQKPRPRRPHPRRPRPHKPRPCKPRPHRPRPHKLHDRTRLAVAGEGRGGNRSSYRSGFYGAVGVCTEELYCRSGRAVVVRVLHRDRARRTLNMRRNRLTPSWGTESPWSRACKLGMQDGDMAGRSMAQGSRARWAGL